MWSPASLDKNRHGSSTIVMHPSRARLRDLKAGVIVTTAPASTPVKSPASSDMTSPISSANLGTKAGNRPMMSGEDKRASGACRIWRHG